MPDGEQFAEPPAGVGRTESGDDEEASMQEFAVPDEAAEAEAAAMSQGPDALAGVSPALLEARNAVEQHLQQQVAQAAGASSVESLQDAGNIQGVGIGLGDEGDSVSAGAEPGAPALTLFTAEPVSAEQARSVVASSLGVQAAATDELPVNVVVTGVIEAQPHRFRLRPAAGGISVAHFRVTAGTIGCWTIGRSSPRNSRLLLLSNNHVIANSNNAVYGDCICQPGPYDGGRCPADQIAILERFVPINFSGGANYVDCATGWCWPDRVRRDLCYVSGGRIYYFRIANYQVSPALGMTVGKTGRTTQLKSGRITAVGVTVNVNYGGGRVANFRDQFAVRASSGDFSLPGDSGSSIWRWDATRPLVGLLFAGGGGTTFANPMWRVLNALDVNLFNA